MAIPGQVMPSEGLGNVSWITLVKKKSLRKRVPLLYISVIGKNGQMRFAKHAINDRKALTGFCARDESVRNTSRTKGAQRDWS